MSTPAFDPVTFLLSAARWDDLPAEPRPEVAFVGRSNVGKSSLLNALIGRRALAKVSGTPGKTRTFNYYDAAAGRFFLVDVPGFGYAKVAQTERDRWARLIGRYALERESLRLLLHLVDSRHPPTALDRAVFESVRPDRYAIVLTKADKLSANGRSKAAGEVRRVLADFQLSHVPVVLTSAETGLGLDAVRDLIRDAAGLIDPSALPSMPDDIAAEPALPTESALQSPEVDPLPAEAPEGAAGRISKMRRRTRP